MKRLKDPIYGYINIDKEIIESIIDTSNFQRLRNITQTSYAPLFASAVHNRFVHSLGVYHLGKIVANAAIKGDEFPENELKNYRKIFEYACLLHDVGHAPFSHTGEAYYLDESSSPQYLHSEIARLTQDKELEEEIKGRAYGAVAPHKHAAAPHELMSVIVGLITFSNLFHTTEERSFFARCITGYAYTLDSTNTTNLRKRSFLNCVISLLNSQIIDVDKLDYLIRDAYITGFHTISIDYERLLNSVSIQSISDNSYEVVYSKAALSVIENVIYAHDAERKWIQNHPVVQYDSYLLKSAITSVKNHYKKNLFAYEYLTQEGAALNEHIKISLLSDADMIFLMKNIPDTALIKEYFSRKNRRHSFWKSEPEYKALFNNLYGDGIYTIIENTFKEISKYLNFLKLGTEINDNALCRCEEDIKKQEVLLSASDATKEFIEHIKYTILNRKKILKWLTCFKQYAEHEKIDFNFVIIEASQFNSGFGKLAFDNIKIKFPLRKTPCCFKEVTNSLSAQKSKREKFFYIYYYKNTKNPNINVNKLAVDLGKLAMEEAVVN